MPVHLQHGFLIACFYNTILAGASTVVVVGVLHELFGFLFVFPTQSWLVAMPELQLVHGLMVTNNREAVDASRLMHLLGTGAHQVSPFVISLSESAAL